MIFYSVQVSQYSAIVGDELLFKILLIKELKCYILSNNLTMCMLYVKWVHK